ncbi:MAG: DNA topoisomerase IB [Catalinimonas sp.]
MAAFAIPINTDPAATPPPPDLVYVSDEAPGYTRVRKGTGFAYRDERGNYIKDKATLARLRALVIPPAYGEVWICPRPDGHLQASGRDERGRKQYVYHPEWTAYRNQAKFLRLARFGHALPRLREQVAADLRRHGWPREKVLALVVRLLDASLLRIGNRAYARENQTYGLTTLRRKHLHVEGSKLTLEFKAKSGVHRKLQLRDRQLARLVKQCAALPGYEIFKYTDDDGNRRRVDSSDVNDYLHEVTGERFTAKDFRTWGGSTLALAELPTACEDEIAAGGRRSLEACLMRRVARQLGNTVSVCREYYVHPAVLRVVAEGRTEHYLKAGTKRYRRHTDQLEPAEMQLLALVEDEVEG